MGDERHFETRPAEFPQAHDVQSLGRLPSSPAGAQVAAFIRWAVPLLTDAKQIARDTDGHGVYVGAGGVAVALRRLRLAAGSSELVREAAGERGLRRAAELEGEVTQRAARHGALRRPTTYLEGQSGAVAAAALWHREQEERQPPGGPGPPQSAETARQLLALATGSVLSSPAGECELFYGRAGFLYSLLAAMPVMHDRDQREAREVMVRLLRQMKQSGTQTSEAYASAGRAAPPLMYEWHDKGYWGGAHGVVGILYVLLQIPRDVLAEADSHLPDLVRRSVDWLPNLRFRSGNYPSSFGSDRDRLLQFCHGAPGFVMLFAKAYELWGDTKYLEAAASAATAVWPRGLLRKGVGLCHGAPGNAYSFLTMYRITREPVWLQRALHYALFLQAHAATLWRHADRPLSLYEGVAGALCFVLDLFDPERARFPGFDLPP